MAAGTATLSSSCSRSLSSKWSAPYASGRCALIRKVNMSEDSTTATGKNFRSSYYKSLGFRDEEKNLPQLQLLLTADPIGTCERKFYLISFRLCTMMSHAHSLCSADLKELRAFCLKYTLASSFRCSVWKVLTGENGRYTYTNLYTVSTHTHSYNGYIPRDCIKYSSKHFDLPE